MSLLSGNCVGRRSIGRETRSREHRVVAWLVTARIRVRAPMKMDCEGWGKIECGKVEVFVNFIALRMSNTGRTCRTRRTRLTKDTLPVYTHTGTFPRPRPTAGPTACCWVDIGSGKSLTSFSSSGVLWQLTEMMTTRHRVFRFQIRTVKKETVAAGVGVTVVVQINWKGKQRQETPSLYLSRRFVTKQLCLSFRSTTCSAFCSLWNLSSALFSHSTVVAKQSSSVQTLAKCRTPAPKKRIDFKWSYRARQLHQIYTPSRTKFDCFTFLEVLYVWLAFYAVELEENSAIPKHRCFCHTIR